MPVGTVKLSNRVPKKLIQRSPQRKQKQREEKETPLLILNTFNAWATIILVHMLLFSRKELFPLFFSKKFSANENEIENKGNLSQLTPTFYRHKILKLLRYLAGTKRGNCEYVKGI